MTIAELIKERRITAGHTQQSLAAVLDVSMGAVAGWEQGLFTPNRRSLKDLRAMGLLNVHAIKQCSDMKGWKP